MSLRARRFGVLVLACALSLVTLDAVAVPPAELARRAVAAEASGDLSTAARPVLAASLRASRTRVARRFFRAERCHGARRSTRSKHHTASP